MGQKVKSNRFRWHNCNWLEKVTGESFYEEEEEESDGDKDEEYFLDHYLLHSAAEFDNLDDFYDAPESTMLMGDNGLAMSAQQYYSQVEGSAMQPPVAYYDPHPLQNSPYHASIEHAVVDPDRTGPPQSFARAHNPLASPGMLFDREPDDEEIVHPSVSVSATQLMPAMEDPLAMYCASFKGPGDVKHNLDAVVDQREGVASSVEYPTGFAVVDRQRGRHQTSSSDRVGF